MCIGFVSLHVRTLAKPLCHSGRNVRSDLYIVSSTDDLFQLRIVTVVGAESVWQSAWHDHRTWPSRTFNIFQTLPPADKPTHINVERELWNPWNQTTWQKPNLRTHQQEFEQTQKAQRSSIRNPLNQQVRTVGVLKRFSLQHCQLSMLGWCIVVMPRRASPWYACHRPHVYMSPLSWRGPKKPVGSLQCCPW